MWRERLSDDPLLEVGCQCAIASADGIDRVVSVAVTSPSLATLAAFIALWFALGGGGGCSSVGPPVPTWALEEVQSVPDASAKLTVGSDGNVYGTLIGNIGQSSGSIFKI